MKYFYSHIINIESIFVDLESLDLKDHHRRHLAYLIDDTLHNEILDLILSQLSAADKKSFLLMLHTGSADDKIIKFLEGRTKKLQQQIEEAVELLKEELNRDISEAKRRATKR